MCSYISRFGEVYIYRVTFVLSDTNHNPTNNTPDSTVQACTCYPNTAAIKLQLWISSRYTQLSTYTLFVDFLHNVMHNTSTTIINSASSISMSSTMIKINVVHSNTPFYVSPTSLKCRSQLYHTTTHYYKPSDNQYYISNYNLHSY
jgi:hypothetical protein